MPKAPERTLVVRDALAARQWEATLLDEDSPNVVYLSPNLVTADAWLGDLAGSASLGATEPLQRAQSDALWRRVIADSPHGDTLLEHSGAARWAAQAWRLLADAGVDCRALEAGADDADFAAFIQWSRAYRARLATAGWRDAGAIRAALGTVELPERGCVELLDMELAPVEAATIRRLSARGWRIGARAPRERIARCRRVACDDPEVEIETALRWGAQRSKSRPGARVAVVLRNAGTRAALLDRLVAAVQSEALGEGGSPLDVLVQRRRRDRPLVAAAHDALVLLSPRGGFAELSRWLRGPLLAEADVEGAATAAGLELDLRGRLLAQVGFLEAYRYGGLRNRFLRDAPRLADKLDAAVAVAADDRARRSPAQWAVLWQRLLRALGWSDPATRDPDGLAAWDKALEEFVGLTPMLGELDLGTALDELATLLRIPRQEGRFPATGVHVLTRLEQLGPGYDAAWVTGLTDASLPEPARTNPLLPRALQVIHAMPWSTPEDALRRAERSLAAARARVDELVLSWPATEYDFETAPSPLIAEVEALAPELVFVRRAPRDDRALVTLDDAPGPQAGQVVRGGARALDLQARCPLRAFCESRLAARPIDAPERGVSARHQGIAVHRALELLVAARSEAAAPLDEALAQAIETALDETFRGARRALDALVRLERARLRGLLERFLEAEAQREPHEPVLLEERRDIAVGGWRVRVRIDRMDRLADGSVAILDYKSGRQIQRPGWFRERLRDPQLPLYLLDARARASSLVIVALEAQSTRYLGCWSPAGAFPGRAIGLPEGRSWANQRDLWQAELEALATELGQGDVRMFADDLELARGAYAPLTRVHEALAMRYREAE